jgi:hypothetical protein
MLTETSVYRGMTKNVESGADDVLGVEFSVTERKIRLFVLLCVCQLLDNSVGSIIICNA